MSMSTKQKAIVAEALKRGAEHALNRSHTQHLQQQRKPPQKTDEEESHEDSSSQEGTPTPPDNANVVKFELDLGRYTGTASNMEQMRLANAAPLLITEARQRTCESIHHVHFGDDHLFSLSSPPFVISWYLYSSFDVRVAYSVHFIL